MMKQVPATLREMYVQQPNENGMDEYTDFSDR
ncbi:hypothetical protein PI124_g23942 [Phytophthora idaei]|nr:hypothetical protein PI125_g26246 [Phytophthora idaei]KAG3122745.1 hypothetical protein PI126_g24021 [Phytophthora idaei]KAG3230962.1 hypothetical protein PI124_g23942 [Phytophthora idaei]